MIKLLIGLLAVILIFTIFYLIGILPYNWFVRDMSLPEKSDYYNDIHKIIGTGIVAMFCLFLLFQVFKVLYMFGGEILKLFN